MTAVPPSGNTSAGDDDAQLKALLKELERANRLAEGAKATREKAAKSRDDARKERKKEAAQAQLNRKALVGVNKLQSVTMKQLNSAFDSSLKMQEKSLGRGMGLGIVLKETTAQQKQLAGTVTGFGEAVDIGYEQFESGLKSSNVATNQLAAYTKVTGGNSLKLLKSMSKLTKGMSLSTEQETALTSSVQGLSQNYKMTTEELMDSLGGLEEGMRGFKLMGVGAEMAKAGVTISAALGKQGGDMGTQLLATLTSAEGQNTAAALGVTRERVALLRGEGDATQNALQMVVKAGSIAKDRIDQMVKGGADPAVAIAALEKTMGKGLGDAALVFEQLNKEANSLGISLQEHVKRVGEKQELDSKFNASWNNFVSQVFSPLKEIVMKLTTGFLDFITQNKDMAVKIGQVIVGLAALATAIVTAAATRKIAKVGATLPGGKTTGKVMKVLFTFLKKLPFLLFSAFTMIPVLGQILLAIAAVVAIIYHFKDEIWAALKWVVGGLWDAFKWVGGHIWDAIWGAFKWVVTSLWDALKWVVNGIVEGIGDALKWVGDKISGLFNWFGDEEVAEPKVVSNTTTITTGGKYPSSHPYSQEAQDAHLEGFGSDDSSLEDRGRKMALQRAKVAIDLEKTGERPMLGEGSALREGINGQRVREILGELRDAQLVSNAIAIQGVDATMNVNKPSPRQAITGMGPGSNR